MKQILWFAFISCALVTGGKAAVVSASDSTIELRGQIVAGDGERFMALVAPGIHTLRIRSPGGDMQTALAIARIVPERGFEVDIDGLCASACAQLILPAASQVRASDGTLVLLHAVGDGAARNARREGSLRTDDPDIAQAFADIASWQNAMDAFLTSVGVRKEPMDFMYELTSASDFKVVFVPKSEGGSAKLSLEGGRDPICRAWLLGPLQLRELGVRAGDWSPGGRVRAGFVLGVKGSDIYAGSPVGIRPEDHAQDCRHFSKRVER